MLKFLFICFAFFALLTGAIHEDEQGLRDFLLRFVGNVHQAVVPYTESPSYLFVRSEEGAVAAISTITSYGGLNLTWRQLFTEKPLCVAAGAKTVVVVGQRGSVYLLNSHDGEVQMTYVMKTESSFQVAGCAIIHSHVNIVGYAKETNELSTYELDLKSEEEVIAPKSRTNVNGPIHSIALSRSKVYVNSGAEASAECSIYSFADLSKLNTFSKKCTQVAEKVAVLTDNSGLYVHKGESMVKEISCVNCDVSFFSNIAADEEDKIRMVQLQKKDSLISVSFSSGKKVDLPASTVVGSAVILTAFSDEKNREFALIKGGGAELFMVSESGLIWRRNEGLANAPLTTFVDSTNKDHFHFNKHLLMVSRFGVLYDVPLEKMGTVIHVVVDLSAKILELLQQSSLEHVNFVSIAHEEGVVSLVVRARNGVSAVLSVDVSKKAIVKTDVFEDAFVINQKFSVNSNLEVKGRDVENTFFYIANSTSGTIKGYHIKQSKAVPTWSMRLPYPLVAHTKGTPQQSQFVNALHVFPNRTGEAPVDEVRHRYPTENVIAVAYYEPVEGELPTLVVTAVDAVTGSTLGTTRHKNVEGEVHMVIVENNLIYYFMDAEKMRYVFGVWEMFEDENGPVSRKDTGVSPPQIIASYFANTNRMFSSNAARAPVIVPSTLGVQGGPLAVLGVTTSNSGIARKNIVLVFESGRVALLELRFLLAGGQMPFPNDPERQITHVVIPSIMYASHKYRLAYPQYVVGEPTRLESSSHLAICGLDIFYVRASSGKPFDLLNSDFNKSLLVSLVAGFAVLAFVARFFVTRTKLNSLWK